MKTTILALSLATTLFLAGCGDSAAQSSTTNTTDITVERGPVLQATVRDANGQIGEDLGNGVYRFTDVAYPVESYGGYIDMNRNGNVDAGDVKMLHLRLKTKAGNVMTMATSLLADTNETNLTQSLAEIGYTEDKLFHKTPTSDMDIAALSDEVYKYCYENNITDPSTIESAQMDMLKERIHERKTYYESQTVNAADLENELMNELNVSKISDDDALEIAKKPMDKLDTFVNAIATSELSDAQKYTLAYMWNEERVAKDLYLAFNDLNASTTLYNIATNGETKHVESVTNLIKKYDLNILNTTDYSGRYSQDALDAYASGEYSITEVGDLYNTLYAKGSASLQDALEVGCMVEVKDITDLDADIKTVEGADDLVAVFENLRSGSYAHYWAFDNALKAQAVSDGCCSLGNEYCKTAEEYPQAEHENGLKKHHH